MIADSSTLADLEVLHASASHGSTLLMLIDKTRTDCGRQHLRRRLVENPGSAEFILERQCAHRALGSDLPSYRTLLDKADLNACEAYLDMKWLVPSAMRGVVPALGRLWTGSWYNNYLVEAKAGRTALTSCLTSAKTLVIQLSKSASARLCETADSISELLNRLEIQALLQVASQSDHASLLDFDEQARTRARSSIVELISCFGDLEAMWSFAAVTVERGWCYPKPGSSLSAKALYHPALGQSSTRNDVGLTAQHRVCFITGPNMAGKSTFLRALALAVILAHAGCGVPAEEMEFPFVDQVFSSLKITDDLANGKSFYLAEVERIHSLANIVACGKRTLAFIDEPFRGTNVHDSTDATIGLVTRLLLHLNAIVFVSSHISDLPSDLSSDRRLRLVHFRGTVAGEDIHFDYRLREGLSVQRLGMALLHREKVWELLEQIPDSANSLLP